MKHFVLYQIGVFFLLVEAIESYFPVKYNGLGLESSFRSSYLKLDLQQSSSILSTERSESSLPRLNEDVDSLITWINECSYVNLSLFTVCTKFTYKPSKC